MPFIRIVLRIVIVQGLIVPAGIKVVKREPVFLCEFRGGVVIFRRPPDGRRLDKDQVDPLLFAEVRDPAHILLGSVGPLGVLVRLGLQLDPRLRRGGEIFFALPDHFEIGLAVPVRKRNVAFQGFVRFELREHKVCPVKLLPAVMKPYVGQQKTLEVQFGKFLHGRLHCFHFIGRPLHIGQRLLNGRLVAAADPRVIDVHHDRLRGLRLERFPEPIVTEPGALPAASQVVASDPAAIIKLLRGKAAVAVAAPQKEHIHRVLLHLIEAAVLRVRTVHSVFLSFDLQHAIDPMHHEDRQKAEDQAFQHFKGSFFRSTFHPSQKPP